MSEKKNKTLESIENNLKDMNIEEFEKEIENFLFGDEEEWDINFFEDEENDLSLLNELELLEHEDYESFD